MVIANDPLSTHSVSGATTLDVLTEALFCSSLQPSDRPEPAQVRAAIHDEIRYHHQDNAAEFASEMAQRYGEDPEQTVVRLRWCRNLAAVAYDLAI